MPSNFQPHKRQSIRLKGYDYSQAGFYFITLCTQNREYLFGNIENGEMILNDAGKMVSHEWLNMPNRFKNAKLHQFVIMPNHFHAILEISNNDQPQGIDGQPQGIAPTITDSQGTVGATFMVAQYQNTTIQNMITPNHDDGQPQGIDGQPQGIAPTLGDMIGAFKSITTFEYIRGVKTLTWQPFDGKLWQRNYWEHIIRNQKTYDSIANYIMENPQQWENDTLNKLNNFKIQ